MGLIPFGYRVKLEGYLMPYLFLAAAIVAEVIATSALKASDGFSNLIPSIIVVVGYGFAFWLLSLTLKSIPVGIAYATWSGAGIILITAVGWIVFGQKLDPIAIVGMVLIIAGVVLINLVSRSAAH
jgi:small multidrug resistance pump